MHNKKKRNTAAQTALMMAVLILISKVLGFIREMVLAYFFGTSYITDAYVLATSIPSIIFGGLLGAVATAYMPLFSNKLEKEGEKAANAFTSQTLSLLLLVAVVSSLLGVLFSSQITAIFASGFTGETAQLTGFFIKVTFSYVLFTSTSGIMESYLQYKRVFLPQIAAGYLLNAAAVCVIVASAYIGHQYLAWGLFLGHLFKFCVTYLLVRRHGFRYRPDFHAGSSVKRIAALTLPVFIGNSLGQINSFVDKTLATNLPTGSASALNYGYLLVGLITGLTATVITTILYPQLTQANTREEQERFGEVLNSGVNLIAIITVPCAFGVMAYSQQAVQAVYERGVFDASATDFTAAAFYYYGMGLVFTSLNTYLTQSFYSRQSMKLPVICSGICVMMNIGLSLFLIRFLAHGGLALASSVSAMCCTAMLYTALRWKYPEVIKPGKAGKLIKITAAGAFSVGLSRLAYDKLLFSFVPSSLLQLLLAVCTAGLLYLAGLWLLRIEELKFLKHMLRR